MKGIFRGYLSSAVISVVLFGIREFFYMPTVPGGWWRPFLVTTTGVLLAIMIVGWAIIQSKHSVLE